MSPTPNRTLTAALVRRIGASIVAQQLPAGAAYMTEQEVAQQFGASRRVAREAVARLRALGVLESRQRRGLTIAKPDPCELLSQTLPFFNQEPDDFWELAKLRYTLEIGALDLAVAQRTPAHLDAMAAAADGYTRFVRAGAPQRRRRQMYELEYAFHQQILQASSSPLIAGLHQVLLDYFHAEETLNPFLRQAHLQQAWDDTAWEHHAIVEAFRSRDVERARALLRHHLQGLLTPTEEHTSDVQPN